MFHGAGAVPTENSIHLVASYMAHELSSGDLRCPFLALSVRQRAANGSKRRHKTKVENRRISRVVGWCVSATSSRATVFATLVSRKSTGGHMS
jgi:hypothetical protein